jgi:hypothetical protein
VNAPPTSVKEDHLHQYADYTNILIQYDYTGGNLSVLLDIVIESGAKLFVSAVGIPPPWAIQKLHKAGVL